MTVKIGDRYYEQISFYNQEADYRIAETLDISIDEVYDIPQNYVRKMRYEFVKQMVLDDILEN